MQTRTKQKTNTNKITKQENIPFPPSNTKEKPNELHQRSLYDSQLTGLGSKPPTMKARTISIIPVIDQNLSWAAGTGAGQDFLRSSFGSCWAIAFFFSTLAEPAGNVFMKRTRFFGSCMCSCHFWCVSFLSFIAYTFLDSFIIHYNSIYSFICHLGMSSESFSMDDCSLQRLQLGEL